MTKTNAHPPRLMERLAWPSAQKLTPAVAKAFLDITFHDNDVSRMNTLSAMARSGRLSTDEQNELNEYEVVSHLLAIIHLKARRALKRSRSVS